MKRSVVLDKNYLQAESKQSIHSLCDTYRVVMSGALFYELLTTDVETRRRCFSKFPVRENPVILVEHVGELLRYEVQHGRPCGQPSGHRINMRWVFNAQLRGTDYELPPEALEVLREESIANEAEITGWAGLAESMVALSPNLLTGSDESRANVRSKVERNICNPESALQFFEIMKKAMPNSPLRIWSPLGKWAHLRWLQVMHLFALDLCVRYQGAVSQMLDYKKFRMKLEHDLHDAQILALAVLEGNIATNERKLLRWWRLLQPTIAPISTLRSP
ncbi:hypothetical protein FVQ98_15580 [Ottowia sp. GY511]|uniref:Uncharacterized protein n=1 Tax=Ottowia flava TaxID=2675430 RepID=A0ABW4KPD1_9BURK|nr:hypothetical protein [Ottowia sp. GY511]TXK24854.1 hypothetical protein FVQ98_15580 [Ottowia sp. GY511]